MSLLHWLDNIDKTLVVLISHDSDSFWLDRIMPVLRDPITWIPLYLFVLVYAIRKEGKNAWVFIVLSLLTFAITDSLTTQLLKPLFGRPRPCFDPTIHAMLRGLVDCGGYYSMPSSHAANHFGLAAFWYYSIITITGKKWKWLWIWAAVICYAQVYVGKHYPSDIIVGAFTGYMTGMGMHRLLLWWRSRSVSRISMAIS